MTDVQRRPDAMAPEDAPSLWPDEEFRSAFIGIIKRLNHMLGTRYQLVGSLPATDALGIDIARVISYDERGERYARDWEGSRIGFLAMDLEVNISTIAHSSTGIGKGF
jgi:hypothetical protein